MSDEIKIELTDMEATPCQWILSFGDLRHIGYVQKSSGFIQLIRTIPEDTVSTIRTQVEENLHMQNLPVGMVPDLTGYEEETE